MEIDDEVEFLYNRMFTKYYNDDQLNDWKEVNYFGGGNIDRYKQQIRKLLDEGCWRVKTGYRTSKMVRGSKTLYIFFKLKKKNKIMKTKITDMKYGKGKTYLVAYTTQYNKTRTDHFAVFIDGNKKKSNKESAKEFYDKLIDREDLYSATVCEMKYSTEGHYVNK